MNREQREAKIRALAEAYAERLREAWPEGETDITRLEEIAEQVGGETNRDLTQKLVREQAEQEPVQEAACPCCGGPTRYKGRYAQVLLTAQGRVRVQRAYYCAACRAGFCPLDRAWGLGPALTTPTVQARTAVLGVWVPYTRLPEVTRQIGAVWRLDVKGSERVTQRVGAAGRSPEACAGLHKESLGGLEDRELVLERACARAVARQGAGAPIAALGDGAHWIWDGYAAHLPHRVEILDFYHACQHLARVAQAMHPEDAGAAAAWLAEQRHELRHFGPWRLLRELAAWEPQGKGSTAARKVRAEEVGYFTRNQERMQYPGYARAGLPIGSGAVEGACKHLVTARFKQAGMRWGSETLTPGRVTNETINLAFGQGNTLVRMAELIAEALGKEPEIRLEPSLLGEVTPYVANIAKANQLLGYTSRVPLEEGVPKAVAWSKEWAAAHPAASAAPMPVPAPAEAEHGYKHPRARHAAPATAA